MSEANVIDLDIITDHGKVHNLAGKERGVSARRLFNLDELDSKADAIVVRVPEHLNAISPSFFLGLFSASIASLGGKDGFLRKYRFTADEAIMEQVMNGIRRAVASRGSLRP